MATRMQQRRGTASQWVSSNDGDGPTLNAGEIGFETDTNKFKIGDGVSAWIDLAYFADAPTLGGSIDDYIPLTQKGVANGVAELDANGKLASVQIPNLDEITQDILDTALVAGTGLDKTYNDAAGTYTMDIDSTVATKTFAAELLTNATKTNITITGNSSGLTITAENGVADSTTDNLTEGSTNKYFTDERAQDAVGNAVGNGLKYTDASGAIEPDLALSGGLYIDNSDKLAVDGYYVTFNSAEQTLINKTLTSPKINEAVELTATATELNILDGATLSTTELNYVDGVTSAIQTQMDAKAPLAGPTFTGTTTTDNLIVDGDFTVNGTNFSASATSITIEDNLVQIAHSNPANTVDLGIVVGYNDGTAKHAGLVKDTSANTWKLFKGVTTEPATTVDFTQGSLDDLAVAGLTASSLTVGDVSNTELGYLNGVTSAIQTQIDAKSPIASPTFTGTVTLADGAVLGTPASATLTNATGLPVSTGISGLGTNVATFLATPSSANFASMISDEIGTGNIILSELATNTQTASYTLVLGDKAKVVEMNVGSANNLTVPLNSSVAYPVGTQIHIVQVGSGQTTVAATGGVTINTATTLKLRAQWSAATLIKRAENVWFLAGDLATS